MRRTSSALLLVGALGAVSCGSAQPEPKAAQPVAIEPGSDGAAKTSYDLSPVAEPADLIAVARWKSPAATLATTAATAGVPSQLFGTGSKMAVEELLKEVVRGMNDTRALAAAVSLDASVDAIAVLDPSPRKRDLFGAVSVGLTSLDGARQAAEASGQVSEVTSGVWRIGGRARGGKSHGGGASCFIVASAGATPGRLICGDKEKEVLALAPYMARTLATAPASQSDFYGEVRFVPIQTRYGNQLRDTVSKLPLLVQTQTIGEPKFDRALVEAATGLSDEVLALTNDVDKLTFEAALNPSAGVSATGALQLRSSTSWLAQTMTDRPERAGAPPEIYWRLPKNSDSAMFGRGADPARLTAIIKVLQDLTVGGLNKLQVGTPADRKAVADLLAWTMPKETNNVVASGHLPAPATPAKQTAQQRVDSFVSSSFGWQLFAFDDGQAAVLKWIKDAVAVYNRPGLLGRMKKELGDDAKFLPAVKIVGAPAGLGKGAMDVEVKFANIPATLLSDLSGEFAAALGGKEDKSKVNVTLHFLVLPDGNATWIAFGSQRDELVKLLNTVKTGAPDAGTLKARDGLDALRNGKNLSAGFMSLASFTRGLPEMFRSMDSSTGGGAEMKMMSDALAKLPHNGETPILLASKVTPGKAPRTELSVQVPKGTLEDVAAIVMTAVKQFQGSSTNP